jgi:hypothetical protein
MKNAVFWDVMPCGCCKNWRFGWTYHIHHQADIVFLCSVLQVLVTANVLSSPICSSETSFLIRATLCNIPEDGILHNFPHKLASVSGKTQWKFLPIANRISHKNIALQDPTCFNLQKLQKAQEIGSLTVCTGWPIDVVWLGMCEVEV